MKNRKQKGQMDKYRKMQATKVPSSANAPMFVLYLAILWKNGSEFGLQCDQAEHAFSIS